MAGILAAAEEDIGGADIEGDEQRIIEEGKNSYKLIIIGEEDDDKH